MSIFFILFPLAALAISSSLTPLVRKYSYKFGILDRVEPFRKIHTIPIPRCGGLGIAISFIAVTLLSIFIHTNPSFKLNTPLIGILLCSAIMLLTGFIDDMNGLNPYKKFIIQILTAFLITLFGVKINSISLPFDLVINLGLLSVPFTIFWITAVTNSFNLIDGLDGLAGGLSSIALFFLFIINFSNDNFIYSLACITLAASIIGFLFFNFNPASIFLGDTGSLFIGFLLSTIPIQTFNDGKSAFPFFLPIMLLAIPLFDTTMAITRRLIQGKHIFYPDKGHIHHKLLNQGHSQRETALILYLFSALTGMICVNIWRNGYSQSYEMFIIFVGIISLLYAKVTLRRRKSLKKMAVLRPDNVVELSLDRDLKHIFSRIKSSLNMEEVWYNITSIANLFNAKEVSFQLDLLGKIKDSSQNRFYTWLNNKRMGDSENYINESFSLLIKRTGKFNGKLILTFSKDNDLNHIEIDKKLKRLQKVLQYNLDKIIITESTQDILITNFADLKTNA